MIWLAWVLLIGLGIGALGRLAVPGRQPMGLALTAVVGVAGSLAGAGIGRLVFGPHPYGHGVTLVLAVAGSALIVWVVQNRPRLL
ncbi:MAG TPA: hypothetical protein VFH45_11645 [Acidimicrobiales bacterium]|nr:hypothetical protein [Acidimicrobiales bacterium]